jgi:chemotaxis protein histidine kinase CheA
MTEDELKNSNVHVCNLSYLAEMTGDKKEAMLEIMNVFIKQISEELNTLDDAIIKADYATIKKVAHSMKSTVSVVGIALLKPVLLELEDLGQKAIDGSIPITTSIETIKRLNGQLHSLCTQAIVEIEAEKLNYV